MNVDQSEDGGKIIRVVVTFYDSFFQGRENIDRRFRPLHVVVCFFAVDLRQTPFVIMSAHYLNSSVHMH